MPGAEAVDPGVKSRERVEEKARALQRDHPEPPAHAVLDLSRVAVPESPACRAQRRVPVMFFVRSKFLRTTFGFQKAQNLRIHNPKGNCP